MLVAQTKKRRAVRVDVRIGGYVQVAASKGRSFISVAIDGIQTVRDFGLEWLIILIDQAKDKRLVILDIFAH